MHREQRRLAGAVRAEDGDDRPGGHVEVDAVQHLDRAVRRRARPRTRQERGSPAPPRGRPPARPRPAAPRRAVPLAEHPAEVEHVDLAAHVHHQLDVVLDEHHGHAVGRHLPHHRAERSRLLLVLPAGRLVEQQHLRRGGQRPGQLHDPSLAGREPVGALAAELGDAEPLEELVGDLGRDRAAAPASAASRTFSRTVRSPNGSRRWNVRARPRRARLNGASLVTSWPSMRTRPRCGGWSPQMTLNSVVLPAPFGPMRPVTTPGLGGEVDRVEGEPAAEADADAGDLERAHPASTASSGSAASPRAASSSRTSAAVSGRSIPAHSSGGRPPRGVRRRTTASATCGHTTSAADRREERGPTR